MDTGLEGLVGYEVCIALSLSMTVFFFLLMAIKFAMYRMFVVVTGI